VTARFVSTTQPAWPRLVLHWIWFVMPMSLWISSCGLPPTILMPVMDSVPA
jgi:hypothetical protein